MGIIAAAAPFLHGSVHGVLEDPGSCLDCVDFGAQKFHAVYVQCLSFGIDFTHEDFAFHAEEGGNGGSGYAVLAGAGFGNEAGLAHPFCQEGLADAVIDLVGAGVVEVFSFQEDAGAAQVFSIFSAS